MRTSVEPALRKTIIVIEPDEAVRTALSAMLSQHGWSVLAFDCGSNLVNLEMTANTLALLCESDLPDLTAGQVLDFGQSFGVPVIFTSHGQQVQEAVDLLRLGARDFLEKPFLPARLLSLLDRLSSSQAS